MNLYKICEQKMKYLNYSIRTSNTYMGHIVKFMEVVNKHESRLVSKDFQDYLEQYNFTSISQQNQVINAIRFLYKEVLGKKYGKVYFKRPRKEKKLPKVIDGEFIKEQLFKIENIIIPRALYLEWKYDEAYIIDFCKTYIEEKYLDDIY